jgi:hypothetical protein
MRSVCLLLALAAIPQQPVSFEAQPRAISTGRDPVVAVRASGALSLLKVHDKDLWLETSFDGGDSFAEPVRVNDVPGEVSSHSESSPRMALRTRSEFYVLWQSRRPGGGSVLRFARSMNWGESFTKAIDVDAAGAAPSQSFYTMNVSPQGTIYVAWLDGRDRGKGREGTSAVYLAKSTDRGVSFQPPVRVTLDTCPCCRPSISFSDEKTVHVSWRGVVDDNIRDIFLSTSTDAGASWKKGVRVAEDNWKLNGCPHSGAATAVLGKRLFVSWTTVRDSQGQLYLAWSDDAGQTFSPRVKAADAVVDPNHSYLATAGDRLALLFQGREAGRNQGWGPVNIFYREVNAAGALSPMQQLGNAGKSASYPVFAFEEPGRLFVTWTEPAQDGHKVILARGRRNHAR